MSINDIHVIKTLKMSDVADVVSGQIMSRISAEKSKEDKSTTEMRVIVPKAITSEGLISEADIPTERLMSMPDERRITKEGDIVIKLSTPFDSATITKEFVGCLVPSFCAIIRKNENPMIYNDYLQAFLNSELCKEQLRAKVAGAVMTILSVGKINEVEIPVVHDYDQIVIGERYRETQEKVKTFKQIIELETKRNDVVFLNMEQK